MNLLIIEDEQLIRLSLQKLFERKGCTVNSTQSGKEAIELILNNDYDVILTDLMLQDITGIDVIEESKKKYSPEEIKNRFIVMTAYTSSWLLEKAKNYECKILSKPFENISDVLNEIMGIT